MINVNSENTLCIIITYNPDISFFEILPKYLKIYQQICVIDNCSYEGFTNDFKLLFENNLKIKFIQLDKNYGIAKALNIGIDFAQKNKFHWVNTFDQDSIPINNLLDYYNMALNKCSEENFIIGVNYTLRNITEKYQDINIKHSKNLITSGCLYPVSIFEKIGNFNENIFIDGVDFDFNLRVLLNHYKAYKIIEPMIKHNIGAEISRNFLFFNIFSSNHNEFRRYYIGRNHIYLTLKYFHRFPIWISKKNIFFLLSIIKIIIVEDQIFIKLKSLFRGINNGFRFYTENKYSNK